MEAHERPDGRLVGVTRILGAEFDTTGVLGVSMERDGAQSVRGFPWWITIPDNRWLSMARSWHFFFAWVLVGNGLVYLAYSALSRHLARDLAPDRGELRSIGKSIRDHLRLRHPTGEAAKRYNVLQKLAYLIVALVLLPLMLLTGLAMSPGKCKLGGWHCVWACHAKLGGSDGDDLSDHGRANLGCHGNLRSAGHAQWPMHRDTGVF